MSEAARKSSNERMRRYRQRMRAKGLRPVQLWLPDTSAPGFAEEMRKQSLLAAASPGEKEVLDWIEAVYEWPAP
jgi:hypothetical protein